MISRNPHIPTSSPQPQPIIVYGTAVVDSEAANLYRRAFFDTCTVGLIGVVLFFYFMSAGFVFVLDVILSLVVCLVLPVVGYRSLKSANMNGLRCFQISVNVCAALLIIPLIFVFASIGNRNVSTAMVILEVIMLFCVMSALVSSAVSYHHLIKRLKSGRPVLLTGPPSVHDVTAAPQNLVIGMPFGYGQPGVQSQQSPPGAAGVVDPYALEGGFPAKMSDDEDDIDAQKKAAHAEFAAAQQQQQQQQQQQGGVENNNNNNNTAHQVYDDGGDTSDVATEDMGEDRKSNDGEQQVKNIL